MYLYIHERTTHHSKLVTSANQFKHALCNEKNNHRAFNRFIHRMQSSNFFKSKWTNEIAPETYTARFETTKGSFDVKVTRERSPKAADRFYQLVKYRYFDKGMFYRVNPGFVAQFGSTDSTNYNRWNSIKVPDEKVLTGNKRGALSFARGGKATRRTDLFINLKDNFRLDTLFYNDVKGFPTFGEVINGMEVVDSLHSGYSDTTMSTLDLMYEDKAAFLKKYPKLDLIEKIYLLKE